MKIGILTYHHACNYGAHLQACALCSRINQEPDMEAEIIDFRMTKEADYYSNKAWSLKRRIKNFRAYRFTMNVYKAFDRADCSMGIAKRSSESLTSDSIEKFTGFVKDKYDIIVAGSDEIWNTKSFRGFPTPYWLPTDVGARKISYAASSRVDFTKMSEEDRNKVKSILSEFEFLGVRDDITYDQIKNLIGDEKLCKCCDPSFIYNFEVGNKLSDKITGNSSFDSSKKTILLMTENDAIAEKVVNCVKGRYNIISVFHWHSGCINIADLDPAEWLETIKNVDLVMASYFHAICFSIMQKTRFIALETPGKSAKLMDLVADTKFEDKLKRDAINVISSSLIDESINAELIEEEYDEFINEKRSNINCFIEALRRNI